jgi:hypothetical protein
MLAFLPCGPVILTLPAAASAGSTPAIGAGAGAGVVATGDPVVDMFDGMAVFVAGTLANGTLYVG